VILNNNDCKAITASGYIITHNLDTLYGTIKLQRFNQVTGGYMFNKFDIESQLSTVYFKKDEEKKFKKYTPQMILGYGFSYDKEDYYFKSFKLDHKSLIKSEREEYIFLYLIHQGYIDLYEKTKTIFPVSSSLRDAPIVIYEFYLYKDSVGLFKVEKNDSIKTINDLLIRYKLNQEFIDNIPSDTQFEYIKLLLDAYDEKIKNN